MGAPVGNQNAVKNRPFADALRRALLADDGKKLRELAEKLIARAGEGEISALREIADRLDGKVTQEISGPDGGPIRTQVTAEELARWMAFEVTDQIMRKAKEEA